MQERRARALERELRRDRVGDLRPGEERGDVGRGRPLAAGVAENADAGEGRIAGRHRRDEELGGRAVALRSGQPVAGSGGGSRRRECEDDQPRRKTRTHNPTVFAADRGFSPTLPHTFVTDCN